MAERQSFAKHCEAVATGNHVLLRRSSWPPYWVVRLHMHQDPTKRSRLAVEYRAIVGMCGPAGIEALPGQIIVITSIPLDWLRARDWEQVEVQPATHKPGNEPDHALLVDGKLYGVSAETYEAMPGETLLVKAVKS